MALSIGWTAIGSGIVLLAWDRMVPGLFALLWLVVMGSIVVGFTIRCPNCSKRLSIEAGAGRADWFDGFSSKHNFWPEKRCSQCGIDLQRLPSD